jgi:hypothetical protein
MTVEELKSRLTSAEVPKWMAYYALLEEEEKAREALEAVRPKGHRKR